MDCSVHFSQNQKIETYSRESEVVALKLEMLRCFAAVAQSGNLADAAERLGRSPSAVSMMLKQFEDHLGKPLFETDRKNKLSPLGSFALEQVQTELRQFDRTVHAIESYAQAGIGLVRIAAVPSVAGTILPQAIGQFTASHPKVQIDLRDMDSASVLHALRQESIDIGIATAPESVLGSRRIPLFSDAFGMVCAPGHPLARASGPVTWQALEGETFIANELCGTIQNPAFQAVYRQANLHVHNTVSLLAMVRAELGVTVLPRTVVQLSPHDTVFRPLENPRALRRLDLFYRSAYTASPAAEVLIRYILTSARPAGQDGGSSGLGCSQEAV
jgi:DNA-binding transcriptional LysR family regulator